MSTTIKSGNTSDPSIFDVPPDQNSDLRVAHAVVCNSLLQARSLTIDAGASFDFSDDGKGTVELWGSFVVNGALRGSVGRIMFHVPDDRLFTGNVGPAPDLTMPGFYPADIGLWGLMGSEIELHAPEVTSWLNCTSGIKNGTATLAASPVGWKIGDRLALCNTDQTYSLARLTSFGSAAVDLRAQFAAISKAVDAAISTPTAANIDAAESELEKLRDLLSAPSVPSDQITYTADNSAFSADVVTRNGRSVYPKMANLTRRFQIVAADVKPGDTNHRAHTAMMHGGCADLQYVEFRNLGPRTKLGRYPIHFHLMHDSPCCQALGCSVWQDVAEHGNRIGSVHGTNNAKVINCVGLRSHGHGFYLEDGTEILNQVIGNLSIDCERSDDSIEQKTVDAQDDKGNPFDPTSPYKGNNLTAHFWLRNNNTYSGNVFCGGTAHVGFMVLNSRNTAKPPPLVISDHEGYGSVWATWIPVSGVTLKRLISLYAAASVTGETSWNRPVLKDAYLHTTNLTLDDPFILFAGDSPPPEAAPYAAAIYLNVNLGFKIIGGYIEAKTGINAHYTSSIDCTGTVFRVVTLINPTYWQSGGLWDGCDIQAGQLSVRPYGIEAGVPLQILEIKNSIGAISGKSPNGRYTHPSNTAAGPGTPEKVGSLRLSN